MTDERLSQLTVALEHAYRPTAAGTFHLLTTVSAPRIDEEQRANRPPLNLSFIVDRSGSMAGATFDLAHQGVEYAIGLLDKHDTMSLVVYDNEIDLLLSQRKARSDARDKAIRRLRRVSPRGSTALAEGWATGCGQLAALADEDRRAICRTILLTDGLANVGETDPTVLARDAGVLATRGITTTTFGVGQHFDELLLAGMADAGQGRYHYIANSAGIVPVFAGELGELLHVSMRDVRLDLMLPKDWKARSLNDLPLTTSGQDVTLGLGAISSDDERVIVWEIEAPAAEAGSVQTLKTELVWNTPDGERVCSEERTQPIEARADRGPANPDVQDRVATILSARAQAEAVTHNRAGRYEMARESVLSVRRAMPSTTTGRQQAADLDAFANQVAAPLSSQDLKDRHFRSRRAARTQKDYSTVE